MLLTHLAALEGHLLAQRHASTLEADAPADQERWRAEFVQQFVVPWFGAELRVERGAIFDSAGHAGPAPTFDVLLCLPHAPRQALADGGSAFPVETVVAAMRLLPVLDEAGMATAAQAARSTKTLRRAGLRLASAGPDLTDDADPVDPGGLAAALQAVPCYLVAVDGPPEMVQTHTWLKRAYREQGIVEPDMPPVGALRSRVTSPALDGVFVLGRGFLNFDNVPFGFFNDATRLETGDICWAIADAPHGSLASLYLQLNLAATAMAGTRLDPRPYMSAFQASRLRFGN